MKNFLLSVISITLMIVLIGCGEKEVNNPNTEKTPKEYNIQEETFDFKYGDITIKMHENAKPIVEKLGEPVDYFESPSCAFQGIDKIYTYADFELYTYPKGEEDFVYCVYITNEEYETSGKIKIGNTVTEVTNAYGNDYEDKNGSFIYKKGKSTLTFGFEAGKVNLIEYNAVT